MENTFDIKDTEENSIQKHNKTLKIAGLVILFFAAQLSSMFIYKRYIQKSMGQKILEQQHDLRLLFEKYRKNDTLPAMDKLDENLKYWKKVDMCMSDPESAYDLGINDLEQSIAQMEKRLAEIKEEKEKNGGYLSGRTEKEQDYRELRVTELKLKLEKVKNNKKKIIQFCKEFTYIITRY